MTFATYGALCTEVYNITKPIGGRILEAMVGTGRLFIPLLEAGTNVEGIDTNSAGMTQIS